MNYNFDEIIDRTGTNCIKYDLRNKIFGKDDVIPMWVADMDFKTPDFIINAINKRLEHEILGYTYRGNEFSESLVSWLKRRHNWDIKYEWINFSPGVVPALNMFVLAYTEPGDKIIVQPPVYFPFFSAVRDNGRIMLENQLKNEGGRYVFDFENLESIIDKKTKMLFLSNPHNPVGRAWTRDELLRLGEICVKHNIIIVSDEIHSDLIFEGYKHVPLASISEEITEITLSCFAPSKTFNLAGMSTSSVVISNKNLFERYNKVLETMHLNMGNIFGAIAMQSAYNSGEEWLKQLISYLSENVKIVRSFFEKQLPEIKLIEPEATYLLWLDFTATEKSNKQISKLLIDNAKVGLSDGRLFGKGGEGFQRINIATPKEILIEALKRIKDVIK